MHYIKRYYYIALLILCGCNSTAPPAPSVTVPTEATTNNSNELLDSEISLYRRAIAQLGDNNLSAAQGSFEKMASKHPELAGPWANLSLIAIKQGDLASAKTFIDKALNKNPYMAQALNLAGNIATEQADVIAAKKYYHQAIDINKEYALAHYNLALLYDTYLQDIPNAISHYQKYLSFTKIKDPKTQQWVNELKLIIANYNQ